MAKISRRGEYWTLDWRDASGRRYRKSIGHVGTLSEKDARTILAAKEFELSTGTRLLNLGRMPAPDFGDFAADYVLWHQFEYPDSHYRVAQIISDHLLPRWQFTPMNIITIEAVEQFKRERRALAKASTVTKELRVLQALFNRAVSLKKIAENPIAGVKAPINSDSKPHLFFETDELVRFYAAASERHAPIWKLLANTGIRRGEARALRWSWIHNDSLRILSTERERTKSGKWREIPLADGARAALAALPRQHEYVLPRMAAPSLSRECARDLAMAGLGGGIHTLRHTYISHLVRSGVPLRTVQLYAGHAHITTTEAYAYLAPGQAPVQALRLSI